MLQNHITLILGYDDPRNIDIVNQHRSSKCFISIINGYSALKNEKRLNIAQVQKTFAN